MQILETSICIPLIIDDIFVGLAGIDVSLERFDKVVKKIQPYEGTQTMIMSSNSQIIAFPKKKYIGKTYAELNAEDDKKYNITQNVSKGATFNYISEFDGKSVYVVYVPINLGDTSTLLNPEVVQTIKDNAL